MSMTTHTNGTGVSQFKTTPLYIQVADAIATRIGAGTYRADLPIPNEGDLAREFGVSSGTMRKALDLLEGRGVLDRRQGRGTFVRAQVPVTDLPKSARVLIEAMGDFNVETRDAVARAIQARLHDLAAAA